MRLPVSKSLPLVALIFATACFGGEKSRPEELPVLPTSGPAADYPMVVGAPYVIAGVTHTPVDTMNYDAVGRAVVGTEGGTSVSAAHHTLPLPSYVEVTALESGKTILVRLVRRGPMSGNELIELSPGAAAQLGLVNAVNQAVRVRRVNPIEPERALLRTGQPAPDRMDTPRSLLTVLQRKLDAQEGVTRPAALPDPAPETTTAPALPAKPKPEAKPAPKPKPEVKPAPTSKPEKKPEPKPEAKPKPATSPAPKPTATPKPEASQAATGQFSVQVGSWSNKGYADAAAKKLGTTTIQSGKFWRVKLGPYASRDRAEAALAKAKAAGYSDARIQRAN